MIRTHALSKRFGRMHAVAGVDLDVREGDVYGFLGPNGSGKTTTVRMLLGLVLATSGEIEVLDRPMPHSAREVLPQVGALIEAPAAYEHLSGRRNLALFDAVARGRRGREQRIGDALERVGLAGVDGRPVRAYSLGMRQRLGLAQALLEKPRLLVLDEPTNGLDPQGIRDFRDLLADLNRDGTTILVSSHLLGEIEQTCSRVGVLHRGRLVAQDEMSALCGPTGRCLLSTSRPEAAAAELGGLVENRSGEVLTVAGLAPAALAERLVRAGVPVGGLRSEVRTLEDVVLAATGVGSDDFGGAGAGSGAGVGAA